MTASAVGPRGKAGTTGPSTAGTRAVLVAGLALLLGAAGCPGVDAPGDGGAFGAPPERDVDVDVDVDAGADALDCDGGMCVGNFDAEACAALVVSSCGGDGGARCDDSAGCQAATLLARYEGERCAAALSDDQRFPDCEDTACAVLVARVCGGAGACADAPGCDPAQRLFLRSVSADAGDADRRDALASCAAALEDADVFAPCGA